MAPTTAVSGKKTPAKGKKTGAVKKVIAKKEPGTGAAKKEPGTSAPKHVFPKTSIKRRGKEAGNAHMAAATPAVLCMLVDKIMRKLAEQAHLRVNAEGKRTITEEHVRAARKEVGVVNLL